MKPHFRWKHPVPLLSSPVTTILHRICSEEVRKSPFKFHDWFNQVIPGEGKITETNHLPSDKSNYMVWWNKSSYKLICAYLHYILTTLKLVESMWGDALGQQLNRLPLLVRKDAVRLLVGVIYTWGTSEFKEIESKTFYTLELFTQKTCVSLIQRLSTRLFLKVFKN